MLARWTDRDTDAEPAHGLRLLTEPQLLMGSAFELSSEEVGSGVVGVWGRGGYSRFDGYEETSYLDGDVTTATLGADYTRGPWLAGLALSHSRGRRQLRQSAESGRYRGDADGAVPVRWFQGDGQVLALGG